MLLNPLQGRHADLQTRATPSRHQQSAPGQLEGCQELTWSSSAFSSQDVGREAEIRTSATALNYHSKNKSSPSSTQQVALPF